MKKSLLLFVVALACSFAASAQITDTIVSLEPSNRNVLIEEYTGVNCGYCPDGHKIANNIKNAHPGRVSIINVHAGGYAVMYTTQFGAQLNNQAGISSYPNGTINRHAFSGSSIQVSNRNAWNAYSNVILGMASPVNIAADAVLDWQTSKVTIRVQLYYTAGQTVTSNALNIAVLQDNVWGPQAGAASFYPQMVQNGQYRHMHMLRHLITGQWGETITDIAQGTLLEKTYEYVIPDALGTGTPVPTKLEDMRFVAFVCEGNKEVLTAVDVPVEIINRPAYEVRILSVEDVLVKDCEAHNSGQFTFSNSGASENLTSVKYTYTVDQTEYSGEWTGNLAPNASTTVSFPTFDVNYNETYPLTVKITEQNGVPCDKPQMSIQTIKNVYSNNGYMYFKLVTDAYADETTFKLFDPNGAVVLSGGPFAQLNAAGTTVHEYDIRPSMTGCYRLEVYDAYGDGINAGFGSGYFEVYSADGSRLFRNDGMFGKQAVYSFDITEPYGIAEVDQDYTSVYPNPATDNVTVNSGNNVKLVEIFNLQGQLVKTEANTNVVSVKELANGMYMMKVTSERGVSMHKVVKK